VLRTAKRLIVNQGDDLGARESKSLGPTPSWGYSPLAFVWSKMHSCRRPTQSLILSMHINIGMYVCMYIPVYIARTCLCKYLSLSLSFGGENASMTYSCRQTNVKWGGDFSGLVLNESIKQIKYLISSNPRGVCPLNGRCKCQVGWLNSQKIICLIKCRIIKWWSANTLQDWSLFKCSVFCFPFVISASFQC